MPLANENERNHRTFKLRSAGATLTFSCSNLFTMTPEERRFILSVLESLEAYCCPREDENAG